jgi:transcription-repair coupling factor (superfamily II helicase)
VFLPPDAFFGAIKPLARLEFPVRAGDDPADTEREGGPTTLPAVRVDRRADDPIATLKRYLATAGVRVLICAESAGRRETMQQYFAEYGLTVPLAADLSAFVAGEEDVRWSSHCCTRARVA